MWELFGDSDQPFRVVSPVRAPAAAALRVLPGRLRDIRLDGQPSWREGTAITGPSHLPLRFQSMR